MQRPTGTQLSLTWCLTVFLPAAIRQLRMMRLPVRRLSKQHPRHRAALQRVDSAIRDICNALEREPMWKIADGLADAEAIVEGRLGLRGDLFCHANKLIDQSEAVQEPLATLYDATVQICVLLHQLRLILESEAQMDVPSYSEHASDISS